MKKKYKALMSAFVMIMFGVIAVCYLMGFTNAWMSYTSQDPTPADPDDPNVDVSDPNEFGAQFSIGDMMINGIKGLFKSTSDNPVFAIIGTAITALGALIIGKAGGAQAFAYIIPIVLITIFANIFIFPIEPLTADMGWAVINLGGTLVPISIFLVVFFNLFMFLAIIDFVSGGRL